MTVHIRPFTPEDTEEVLALRSRAFEGLDLERERVRWTWEFEANPFSRVDLPWSWVAEKDGRLVGNYGMLPVPLAVDGRRELGLCGIDACVDPAYRSLGLGVRLTRQFLQTPGCDLLFVTSATADAARLLSYFGTELKEIQDEPSLWIHAAGEGVPGVGQDVAVVDVASFDERCDALFDRVAAEHRLLTLRDRHYMNWRYRDYPFGEPQHLQAFAVPGPEGGFRGLAVLQYDPQMGRAYLLEMLAPAGEQGAVQELLDEALRRKTQAGWGDLYALHRCPAVHAYLESRGFQRVASHDVRILLHAGKAGPRLEDWYVTAGDGDLMFTVGR